MMLYSILETSLLVAVTPSQQLKSDQAGFVLFYKDSFKKHYFPYSEITSISEYPKKILLEMMLNSQNAIGTMSDGLKGWF